MKTKRIAASTVEGPFLVKVGSTQKPVRDVMVPTLQAASEVVREFIEDEAIGASDWRGGQVCRDEEGHEDVAMVSYNGRVWEPDMGLEVEFDLNA